MSQVPSRGSLARRRRGQRVEASRKSSLKRLLLEGLEARELLAVVPPVTVDNQVVVTGQRGAEYDPSVAVDPNNPNNLVVVYSGIDPAGPTPLTGYTRGAASTNGGQSWTSFSLPGLRTDPSTSPPNIQPYRQYFDASVAFDRNGRFYIVAYQGTGTGASAVPAGAAAGAGAVVFATYNFGGGSPTQVGPTNVLYEFLNGDSVSGLSLAVDNNLASFTDVNAVGQTVTQNDPFAGNVYVAWVTNNVAPAGNPLGNDFNPNRIELVASSDGGVTFSEPAVINDAANFGAQRNARPHLTVSQGSVNGQVTPGQVTLVWTDTGSLATASPPLSLVESDRVRDGASVFEFTNNSQTTIIDASDPGNNMPHVPGVTPVTIPVSINAANFNRLTDLNVRLSLTHPNLDQLLIELVPPTGSGLPTVTLTRNQTNAAGTTNAGIGIGGADLGTSPSGIRLGTIFDDDAARSIVDIDPNNGNRGAAAPFTGRFRSEGANSLVVGLDELVTAAQVLPVSALNGAWTLRITDHRSAGATPPPQFVAFVELNFVAGLTPEADRTVATVLRNIASPPGTNAVPVTTSPVIAADNTLGAFSQFQGRLYVAYVDRFDFQLNAASPNPADNGEIALATSDNGGLTWQVRQSVLNPVNDDNGTVDGFSEAQRNPFSGTVTGRPQLQPQLAVDQATGTLVASWLDGRYDASRNRFAYMVTASIDGGSTFSENVFANAPRRATDAITGRSVVLGPLVDNFSATAAGAGNVALGTGSRQGLAAAGGRIYPVWMSNGGSLGPPQNQNGSDIRVAPSRTAAGPRVVGGTMGPVGEAGDSLNAGRSPVDGGPQAQSLIVTFDRRVDPASFDFNPGAADQILFAANFEAGLDGFTIDNAGPDLIAGTSDDGLWHRSNGRGNDPGHSPTFSLYYGQGEGPNGGGHFDTGFRNAGQLVSPAVTLPSSGSLALRLNYFLETEGARGTFDLATIAVENVATGNVTTLATNSGSLIDPTNGFQSLTADLSGFAGQTVRLRISFDTIDAILNAFEGFFLDDVTIVRLGVPSDIVIVGRDTAGNLLPSPAITGVTALDTNQFGATVFRIDFTAQATPGTYSYAVGPGISDQIRRSGGAPGNLMDQDADARSGEAQDDRFAIPRPINGSAFTTPFDRDTLPLIVPGPHIVATQVTGVAPTGDNLVLNDVVSSVDVTFDRDMNPSTFTAADVLRILGPAGLVPGPYTVVPVAGVPGETAGFERTYRVGFPTQQLSGTYLITIGPDITSRAGHQVDTNLNAGVDRLFGIATGGQAVPVTFPSTDTPKPLPDLRTTTSTITITDNFLIQDLDVTLNIQHPNDPDLTATLIAPDGLTRIRLFSGVGATGTRANFTNTVLDDQATTPIANGGPPFFGRFNPTEPLGVLNGTASAGVWTLEIQDGVSGSTGTLLSWSLTLGKPVPATGLGEPVADRTQVGFRIFTMDPTDPLASNTWTAVGPAAIGVNGISGRIGGLAIDPSDPSGNTVFIGGASGGVWKTTNFLTDDSRGPTYVPLTDFGPSFGTNIGGLAVFGRNNDPNQSIVFALTGEGDTGSRGVGFLRSLDGGATWTLLDSTDNNLPFAQRDHLFALNGGTTGFKVLVDPRPTPTGDVIVYAAISGGNGGFWRSLDTGQTWQNLRPGQATDITFDLSSGTGAPGGNLQVLYAAFRGEGVFITPNRGQVFNRLDGGVGTPLIQDFDRGNNPVEVNPPPDTPNGPKGRIVLANPFPTGNPAQDLIYSGWLYAAVARPDGRLDGLYLTKDFGQNWTRLRLPTLPPLGGPGGVGNRVLAVPSNDNELQDYSILGGAAVGLPAQGNYDIALAIDPTDPNVVYLGGQLSGQPTGFIRVDATLAHDAHALVPFDPTKNDGGQLFVPTNNNSGLDAPALTLDDPINLPAPAPFLNLIRNPANPFAANATITVRNSLRFNNTGDEVQWKPFDFGVTDSHRLLTFVDPLTGHARLILGDDQGVWSIVDNDGFFGTDIGTADVPAFSRNGNLQITQFYYGAAQPGERTLSGQIQAALFYGSAQDNGGPASSGTVLQTGNIAWSGPGGDATGVATDQQGRGHVSQFFWPCCGGGGTDFFRVSDSGFPGGTGRTFGLLQNSLPGPTPDPQWPFVGGANFAVNPLNGGQVIISAPGTDTNGFSGRIFRTEDEGRRWFVIGEPANGALDNSYAPALAFGAPDPNGPGGVGNLDNFLYAGTIRGNIFVTQTGGGGNGNQWVNINNGDLQGNTSPVQAIITNPTRGSHEAYAVTLGGVYHNPNAVTNPGQAPAGTWRNISGNLFTVMHEVFGDPGQLDTLARGLTSIVADWRYVIPRADGTTHPMLYVSAQSGVYRSLDEGQTWTRFPSQDPLSLNTTPDPPGAGGGLPNAHVSDLDLSLGFIDPTTGRPDVATGPNILLATTFGRGSFAIRLAPYVFPTSLAFDPTLPAPGGSDSGASSTDRVTNVLQPVINGLSEQSAFGNVVFIDLLDLTPLVPGGPLRDPATAPVIGGGQTDAAGKFTAQVAAGVFRADGSTDGVKTIGVRPRNPSGTLGNIALLSFTLDTTPPALPSVPDLQLASDSGLSTTDNITNDNSPTFDINTAEPTTTVTLLRDGVAVASRVGPGPITDPGPVPDGVHVYRAQQVDLAGNNGGQSAPLSVTVDTAVPARPPAPTLVAADDSGTPGDNITNVNRPRLSGTAEAGGLIELIDLAGTAIGNAPVAGDGTYTVQPTSPLADSTYNLRVRALDVAGNASTPSLPLSLTILTRVPNAPTLALVPADDTGILGDNITRNNQPRLSGTATAGLNVDLLDAAGNVLTTVIAAPNGSFLVQFPNPLPDGPITVRVRARDVAGNSNTSPPLTITIDTMAPVSVPTLTLDPRDDTGGLGDNRTVVRRPRLIGQTEPGVSVDLVGPGDVVLATAIASPVDGRFTLQLANDLANGVINLRARVRDAAGNQGPDSTALNLTIVTVAGDYDGDGQADPTVFRRAPAPSVWSIQQSAFGPLATPFGGDPTDTAIQGDFDGDGRTDLALHRFSTSQWFVLRTQNGPEARFFGQPGVDLPVPADYDGDGLTDFAVYRPTTAEWFIIQSRDGARVVTFGQAQVDIPIPADYDGDGRADLAVYRPPTAEWFILQSTAGPRYQPFGQAQVDVPVPQDYDGDAKTDIAVFRPTTAQWFILQSTAGPRPDAFGLANDVPAPQDYDGDGKADLAVFRQPTAQFLIRQSGDDATRTVPLGTAGDVPAASPYSYRRPALAAARAVRASAVVSTGAAQPLDFGVQASSLASSGLLAGPARFARSKTFRRR